MMSTTRAGILPPFLGVLLIGLAGCGGNDDSVAKSPTLTPEITPEEMAEELGVPNEPGGRVLKPSDFARYPLVVDVFRRSTALPILGAFDPRYVDLLTSPGSGTPAERMTAARASFEDLARREFAVISLNGRPIKAQIISGALEGWAAGGMRRTPPGAYKLDIRRQLKQIRRPDGTLSSELVDFPWLRSAKFGNSIMYWGLWIFGGYFIHSTTHYGELGTPASMGCIRQTYPDAMELFRLRQANLGMIRIHAVGSRQGYERLRELSSPEWTLVQLADNRQKIGAYVKYASRTEISVQGHAWIDPATGTPARVDWPNCGPVDCFGVWGRRQPLGESLSLFD